MGEVFKLNHCYNVDCVPAMELFPDNYFDLAVVDPPYFSGPERRGFYGSKVSKIGVHRDYPISPAWIRPGPEYFRELLRVSRHYIVWGCNYFDYKFATGRIVWDKCNGSSSFSDCEIAATDLFTSVRLFRYMWSGMMQGKSIALGTDSWDDAKRWLAEVTFALPLALEEAWKNKEADNTTATDKSVATDAAQDAMQKA